MAPDLHAKAKARAASQHRSLTGHIIWLIEQDLKTAGNAGALTTPSAPYVVQAPTEPVLKVAEKPKGYHAKKRT